MLGNGKLLPRFVCFWKDTWIITRTHWICFILLGSRSTFCCLPTSKFAWKWWAASSLVPPKRPLVLEKNLLESHWIHMSLDVFISGKRWPTWFFPPLDTWVGSWLVAFPLHGFLLSGRSAGDQQNTNCNHGYWKVTNTRTHDLASPQNFWGMPNQWILDCLCLRSYVPWPAQKIWIANTYGFQSFFRAQKQPCEFEIDLPWLWDFGVHAHQIHGQNFHWSQIHKMDA